MRIVFISDLHSNIYAVEALDKDLKIKVMITYTA
jgi:hypothetical protein